jgi:hypothetical protein
MLPPVSPALFLLPAALAAPRITVYTMGPGDEVFSRFGHAAVCVDQRCYNYGTADFTTPLPLTVGVVRGEAEFWVSQVSEPAMLAFYEEYERTVWAQQLPLSDARARALARALAEDARPENRFYTYHHFDDNCTTRIRDMVDAHSGGALAETRGQPFERTMRSLVRDGLATSLPLLAGSELGLGRVIDRTPSLWEAMFLPRVFREQLQERLGAEPVQVITGRDRPAPDRALLKARALFLGVSGLFAALAWRWRGVAGLWPGLLACALWASAAVSPVPILRQNELLLVLWPADIAAGWLPGAWRRRYAGLRLGALALAAALALAGVLHQPLWLPLGVAATLLGLAARGRGATDRV